MELSYEETERYIDLICGGIKCVEIDGVKFLFKQPCLKDRIKARFIYANEYTASVKDGFLTYAQMDALIELRKLVTDEDRSRVIKLDNEIKAQQAVLSKTTKVRARQDAIKEVIYKKKQELKQIQDKERMQYAMTAETKAEEARILFLCWVSCFDYYTEEHYWESYEDFLKETKYVFRQRVVNEFIPFFNGLPTAIIRAVARGSLWRIKYVTSMKTSEPLFGVPTAEYTNDMSNLAYWSQYYNNIYEMLPEDRPSDLILDDDDALDAFMKDYYEEKNRDSARKKGKKTHGKLSAYDKEEVIVTGSDPLYKHIDYDNPREAATIKDKNLLNKRTRKG